MQKKKRPLKKETSGLCEGFEAEAVARMKQGDRLLGEGGIFTEMLQRIVNTGLVGEMDYHLQQEFQGGHSNRRNGHTTKTVRSESGQMSITPPRDRLGNYEPELVKKWDRQLGTGMDGVILSLYARGSSN